MRSSYSTLTAQPHITALCGGRLGRSPLQKESRRAAEASDLCAYCGAQDGLQWDHLIPLARGGPDAFDNLVRACGTCNASKGAAFVTLWADGNGVPLVRWLRARHLKLLLDEAEARGVESKTGAVAIGTPVVCVVSHKPAAPDPSYHDSVSRCADIS